MTLVSNGGTTTLGLYDTQSQLAQKADITYVDNKIDPLVGGHKGYATLAQAQASQSGLSDNTVVEVLSDTTETNNGYYLWNGTTLTKTPFNPLVQANNYTDSKVATSKAEAIIDSNLYTDAVDIKNNYLRESIQALPTTNLFNFTDVFGNTIGYVDKSGKVFWTGLSGSVQDSINALSVDLSILSSSLSVSNSYLNGFHLVDLIGNYVFSVTPSGDVYLPKMTSPVQKEFQKLFDKIDFTSKFPNPSFLFNFEELSNNTNESVSSRFSNFKGRISDSSVILKPFVSTLYGDGGTTTQRIPSLLKLSETQVLMLFNQGIVGYDGDGTGAKMYQRIFTIGANDEITASPTKLFYQVNDTYPAGVVKHAELCRLPDNRICCLFEINLQTSFKYKQMICYSSDNGETWTVPTEVVYTNSSSSESITLSTDSKTLVLPSGRLIQAIYRRDSYKVACIYSDDNGLTWTISPYVDSPTGTWHTESTFVRLSTGVIRFWFRDESNPGFKRIYESSDNGESLQYVGNAGFKCPPCQSSTCSLSDGTIIMSSPTNINNRDDFKVMYSFDNGETFSLKMIPTLNKTFHAYSSIISLNNDRLFCAVEGNWGSGTIATNSKEDIGVYLINTSGIYKYGFNN